MTEQQQIAWQVWANQMQEQRIAERERAQRAAAVDIYGPEIR